MSHAQELTIIFLFGVWVGWIVCGLVMLAYDRIENANR